MTAVIDHEAQQGEEQLSLLSRFYNDAFAWPTTIDSATGDVCLRLGTTVDALFMHTGLAGEVNNFLVRHMLCAPIVVVPGAPGDWIFLTQPRTTLRLSVWQDLVRIGVGWKRRGETILLPALDNVDNGVRWLQQPRQCNELPPWNSVVAAVRRTSSLHGAW